MFLVSHKLVFIKKEVALLCVTMRERARAFAAIIYLQLFDLTIVITKLSFCGALFKRIVTWERDISKR